MSTRPAISLSELLTEDQLLKLIKLATSTSEAAWSSHAVCCLLQDLLEGTRLYSKPCGCVGACSCATFVSSQQQPFDLAGASTSEQPPPRVGAIRIVDTIEEAAAAPYEPPPFEAPPMPSTSGASAGGSGMGNDEGFAEGDVDEDTQDAMMHNCPKVVSKVTNSNSGFNLPSLLESDDSELEDFLDDILERGKNMLKKGSQSSAKIRTTTTYG